MLKMMSEYESGVGSVRDLADRLGEVGEEQAFGDVLDHVRCKRGLDCSQYKKSFLRRRLAVRIRARSVSTCQEYLAVLRSDPAELEKLITTLTINLSYFFRDKAAIERLKDTVLVPLIAQRTKDQQQSLTVWSAGCAAGEEPYSIAMILADLLQTSLAEWRLVIHATDVDATTLARACQGVYRTVNLSPGGGSVPIHLQQAHYVARYFIHDGDTFTIRPEIRRLITFRQHDITTPPPWPRYDLVLCRNVLIYFAHERQEEIVRHLIEHLEPGGYLMLGMAEMLPPALVSQLDAVDGRLRIYRKPVKKVTLKNAREKS